MASMGTRLDRMFPGEAPVLLDGAMGTALRRLGWPVSEATVLANLGAPALVTSVHESYRRVGARVLHTNTFGALLGADASHDQRLNAVRAAVRLARSAARDDVRVAGSLGAYDLAFHGPRLDDVVRVLVEEGVDLLVFETCNTVRDAQLALAMRREYAPGLPLVVCCSTTDGSPEDRRRVAETAAMLVASEEDVVVGLNCCRGPHEAFKVARGLPVMPRWLKPNKGSPDDLVDDNVMAAFARAARLHGVRFVGGCCGSDEQTLLLMAAALTG
jgi:methionine synthase I (cobalamin-dependent)